MCFPKVLQEVRFPVPGCPAVAHSAVLLPKYFMFFYFRSKVAVFQDGKEPLPCCDLCIINMLSGRLIRHRKTARCNRNTHMRWRRWDVSITASCSEAMFILTGE